MSLRQRSPWTAVALVVCATFVAGCSDPSSEPPPQGPDEQELADVPVTALEGALRGPGTTVVDGVEVQEGSQLVVGAFPLVGRPMHPTASLDQREDPAGWQALFVIDGDPVEVWERYASALGEPERAAALQRCTVTRLPPHEPYEDTHENRFGLTPPAPVRFLTGERIEGENQLSCSADLERLTMSMVYGTASATKRGCSNFPPVVDECVEVPVAHLLIEVLDDDTPLDPARSRIPPGPTLPPGELVLPRIVVPPGSELPGEGEPFDARLDSNLHSGRETAPVALIPQGGQSLVAPAQLISCYTGTVAVLTLPMEPQDAVDWYVQPGHHDDDPERFRVRGNDEHGRAWQFGVAATASGYAIEVLAVEAEVGGSTVLLRNCGE